MAMKMYPLYISGMYNYSVWRPTFVMSPREEWDFVKVGNSINIGATKNYFTQVNPSGVVPREILHEEFFKYDEYLNKSSAMKRERVVRNVHLGGYQRIAQYVKSTLEYFGQVTDLKY